MLWKTAVHTRPVRDTPLTRPPAGGGYGPTAGLGEWYGIGWCLHLGGHIARVLRSFDRLPVLTVGPKVGPATEAS